MSNLNTEKNIQKYKRHNPKVAVLLSLIPGLGQFYNKRFIKGSVLLILYMAFFVLLSDFLAVGYWGIFTLGTIPVIDDSRALIIQGLVSIILTIIAILFYVVNLIDAYKDAEKIKKGWEKPSLYNAFTSTWDHGFPYMLISPAIFMLIFVIGLPLLFVVVLAFTNYNLYNAPPHNLLSWVGFDNFKQLFTNQLWRGTFLTVLSWTVIWTFVATTLQIALAMLLALIINDERIKFKKMIRTVFILPWAVPSFVTILIFAAMFNDNFGTINRDILSHFDIFVPWLTNAFWTKIAIILVQVWVGFPFVFALFTGVLQSISKEWYEAADVDGGSKFAKFRFITFPHLMYATGPLLIMQYAINFNNFNIIYLFNQGGPAIRGQNAGGTDILISWVYGLTFESGAFNMAATITIILGLIVSVFAGIQFSRSRSFKEEGNI